MFDLYQALQAEPQLGPATYRTLTGIQVSADETVMKLPDPGSVLGRSHVWIAWKSYRPEKPTSRCSVLIIPGEYLSGEVYHSVALSLAERGIAAYGMSLGSQGFGYWMSFDSLAAGKITLERLVKYHAGPVIAEIRRRESALILAGDGVGGLVAQLYARQDPDVPGLILLGSCAPRWAASVWKPERRWSIRHPHMPERLTLDDVRRLFLPAHTPDQEVFALWRVILNGHAYPQVRRDAQRLTRESVPSVPALVMAGEYDANIPKKVVQATANEYGIEEPIILRGGGHLFSWGTAAPAVADSIATFCERLR